MKVLVQNEGSGWVLDNIVSDYIKHTRHEIVDKDPDLAWCASMHRSSDLNYLKCKKVVSVHHIDKYQMSNYPPLFDCINSNYDYCISPNDSTIAVASQDISIPFRKIPYWILSDKMKNIVSKKRTNEIVIGSFLKDSWGQRPKLSKGPDLFLEILVELNKTHNIKVILSGRGGREYVREVLDMKGIKYSFSNMHGDINELYNKIDWYFVTSKYEGGPQSVLECSYRGIKMLSTDVGMARDVLHEDCICNSSEEFVAKFSQSLDRIEYNKSRVEGEYLPEIVVPKMDDFFEEVMNG